jgi:hypothetical protein
MGPTQPSVQYVEGIAEGALLLGLKRQKREGNHLPPTSDQVKKSWIYKSTPTGTKTKQTPWPLVRKRIIPTKQSTLVDEI